VSLELKLKNQQIDDQQAKSLAGSLITTTALQKLKLINIDLTESGALEILSALNTQPEIKTFLLISPQGTEGSTESIVNTLQMNPYLTLVHLDLPGFSAAHKNLIDGIIRRNQTSEKSLFSLLWHHCFRAESHLSHQYVEPEASEFRLVPDAQSNDLGDSAL
jgi:hypothetical protein